MEFELKSSLCRVDNGLGGLTRGGSQMLSENSTMKGYGCGIVASAELAVYLFKRTGRVSELIGQELLGERVSGEAYNRLLDEIRRRYIPIIPRFGVNAIALAGGLNLLLRRLGLEYRCRWCFFGRELYDRIREMLEADIPVILAVGPNFPNFLGKKDVPLMRENGEGCFERACSTRAHYVIVTGMDSERLRISSWGKEYFIDRGEYDRYVKKNSSSIVSNIMYVKKAK